MPPTLSIPINPSKQPLTTDGRAGAKEFLRRLKELLAFTVKYQAKIREALPAVARPYFDQFVEIIPVLVTLISLVDLILP